MNTKEAEDSTKFDKFERVKKETCEIYSKYRLTHDQTKELAHTYGTLEVISKSNDANFEQKDAANILMALIDKCILEDTLLF